MRKLLFLAVLTAALLIIAVPAAAQGRDHGLSYECGPAPTIKGSDCVVPPPPKHTPDVVPSGGKPSVPPSVGYPIGSSDNPEPPSESDEGFSSREEIELFAREWAVSERERMVYEREQKAKDKVVEVKLTLDQAIAGSIFAIVVVLLLLGILISVSSKKRN